MGLLCCFGGLSGLLGGIFDFLLSYWKVWLALYIVQGLIGVWCFEWAWKQSERARLCPQEIRDEFPAFCKRDAPNWKRSMFYPGCFIMLIPRLVMMFSTLFAIGFVTKIIYIG